MLKSILASDHLLKWTFRNMNFFSRFTEALFPDRCVDCGTRGALLCFACIKKISPALTPEKDFIASVFSYHDFRVKRLVWLLKYRNKRNVAKVFAPPLAAALLEFLGEENSFLGARKILLVPVPLSKKRYAKRGYNQAELIAQEIIKNMPEGKFLLETKLLKKRNETKPQADIKKKSLRLINLGDCFEIFAGRKSNGEVVFLIDDVTTTGATLMAARKVLRAAGFNKVYALTIAH